MPDIAIEIDVKFLLLNRLLGVKAQGDSAKVSRLKADEMLMINIGSTSLGGKILTVKKEIARIQFINPVCANIGDKIAISRRIVKNFRLIGWGTIQKSYSQKSNQQTADV